MRKLSILIVGGHPADAFDNAGGTLCHHAERGDRVTALVLTQGVRIHDVVISEQLRLGGKRPSSAKLAALMKKRMRVKQGEVMDACKIMGFDDVRFMTYEDSVLTLREDLMQDIAKVIREVKPDILITHYPFDNGGIADHHAITGQLVLNAVGSAANIWPDDPNLPHRVAQIFFMGIPGGMFRGTCLAAETRCFPDLCIDITDVIERKIRAIDQIVSQQYDGAYSRKRAEAVDGNAGLFAHVAYAETFITYYPEVLDYLFVSENRLNRANEPEAEGIARADKLIAHTVPMSKSVASPRPAKGRRKKKSSGQIRGRP